MHNTRCQAQRDAVLQMSSAYTAHNATANPLAPELMECIVKALPRSDLPAVRLASKQFAAAVDPLIAAVTISSTSSSKDALPHGPTTRLQHVLRANVDSSWGHVHTVLSQLPKLDTVLLDEINSGAMVMPLTLAASLVHLTRLDVFCFGSEYLPAAASGVQLPGLRVLSVCIAPHNIIAAFAPHVQELFCVELRLTTPAAPLQACSHFGASRMDLAKAKSVADALAAFSAAFPKVQVVSRVPELCIWPSDAITAGSFLQQLPYLHAARDEDAFSAACYQKLHALSNLRRLSLHINRELRDAQDINLSLTQLQHLQLSFLAPRCHVESRCAADLVHSLGTLQHLVTLELPAQLLCQQCVASGSLPSAFPPASGALPQHLADAVRVQQGLQALAASSSLESLAFVRDHWCRHGTDMAAAAAALMVAAAGTSTAAAAEAAAGHAQQQVRQRPLKLQVHTVDISCWGEPHLYSHDSSKSVWGVYGPPNWE